ncbi:MAG: GT4 family glycosyltransferase PelF [Gammaproteobacteria bacterium]|nr:GT4 family glycosyltransferase PelF [Gammaproteobacteria bacterium]MCP5136848.1 GT4 family glycosyltransferase PelF [Gammaproteobacteria bacterium]
MTEAADAADVCLILEGSYPYVAGGVSSWTHDLIRAQPDLSFHLLTLVAPNSTLDLRYELPPNVTGVTVVTLQRLGKGRRKVRDQAGLMKALEPGLRGLSGKGGLEAVSSLLDALHAYGKQSREPLGSQVLLNSRQAWETLLRMYHSEFPNAAFLDYFWTWRGLFGGAYAVLLAPLPKARVYHAVSTGYAGLMMARAKLDTGAATILTEHGIYTNERRIELSMADWLYEESSLAGLVVDREKRGLRDLWMNSFESYSRATYAAADHILTLFQGNQSFQLNDGADPARMRVIPNGIDFDAYSAVEPVPDRPPTIALIGRVVPIKDVKTYIRAIAQVREVIPEVEAYLLGPYDEDPAYYAECEELVEHLHLRANFEFTGRVKLTDWMGRIDLMALTSISEGQPLVILEAGAAGIPTVATHVGACRDLIEGDDRESPPLGPGGRVVPLSNPSAAAGAMIELLRDRDKLKACGEAMRERVRRYYNKSDLDRTYRELYEQCFAGENRAGRALVRGSE